MNKTGVYSNKQIKEALNSGNIVIDPYNEKQVNGSSVDVRLGEYYYKISDPENLKTAIFSPYDSKQISQHFDGPHRAKTVEEISDLVGYNPAPSLNKDSRLIVLQPNQRILGHTQEYIGIINGTTSMQARSSLGRLGLSVCLDAGWGDPGYVNRWTMEIYNNNERDKMLIAVGTRIAQIIFFHTGTVDGEYAKLSGNYQAFGADDLESIKENWKPSDMLPKALTIE